MNISIIQHDIAWENKANTFPIIENLLSALSDADIVILPEMFNTGFTMNTAAAGEAPRGLTFDWMVHLAENGNYAVCGSYIVSENGVHSNRWMFVTPEKESWFYDKRHLFRMGNEHKAFTPGKIRQIISFRGMRICPIICYDLRFPVWSRNRNDYDILINSACWPASRRDVWITLLRARAIENQCFVAGANRIGIDGNGISYSGDSMIINPFGEIIASSEQGKESIISAGISLTELSGFRKEFPVHEDADEFTIIT
jgi:predicted amidohydrolase